jgi:uncharacterized repeat protein (TIGR03803 family)
MNRNRKYRAVSAVLTVILALGSAASAEWKEKVLYSFQGVPDGAVPTGAVVFDEEGNLYGATLDGGSSTCDGPGQCGTVYKFAPPATKGGGWTETVLYVFKGHAQNDGATPEGGLVIDEAGNLFGTTGYGGSGPCLLLGGAVGCGTVYELSPPAKQGDPWTETVIYSFQGGKDGYVASGDLVFDTAGNLYGATLFGGGKGTTCDSLYGGQCGTVFKLSPPKTKGGQWTEKVLHRFAGGTDGAEPNGGLVLDSEGAVYGTTSSGGNQICKGDGYLGCGTVFKLAPSVGSHWAETTLHRFQGYPNDGELPLAGLVFDSGGSLYGTTTGGGDQGEGTVFALKHPTGKVAKWNEALLHQFTAGHDGAVPMAPLTLNPFGTLLGTASIGGTVGGGSVFLLRVSGGHVWTFSALYTFKGSPDGSYPASGLTQSPSGNYYGTTQQSGDTGQNCGHVGCGVVFEVKP